MLLLCGGALYPSPPPPSSASPFCKTRLCNTRAGCLIQIRKRRHKAISESGHFRPPAVENRQIHQAGPGGNAGGEASFPGRDPCNGRHLNARKMQNMHPPWYRRRRSRTGVLDVESVCMWGCWWMSREAGGLEFTARFKAFQRHRPER